MNQLNNELRDLVYRSGQLHARALHRVEELENDFDGVVLPGDVKKNFLTLRRFITRV